jgi:hypothetical protein
MNYEREVKLNFKDIFWDEKDKPSLNELEARRYFYGGTATVPLTDDKNAVASSTFCEEVIQTTMQEKYTFSVFSYGNGEVWGHDWIENKERDRYLKLGLESFDIFDD